MGTEGVKPGGGSAQRGTGRRGGQGAKGGMGAEEGRGHGAEGYRAEGDRTTCLYGECSSRCVVSIDVCRRHVLRCSFFKIPMIYYVTLFSYRSILYLNVK